jgi:large subunit ribosomal protein L13
MASITTKTTIPKVEKLEHQYYLIDAKDKILGRIATQAAVLLRGKHKVNFTPYMDMGDHVIIINAEKFRVTGRKMQQKEYRRYSGYPSGLKVLTLAELLSKAPTQILKLAVNRMIPKGRLGSQQRRRLRVYRGDAHPHQAQKPILVEIK